jgi:hypothetical protein
MSKKRVARPSKKVARPSAKARTVQSSIELITCTDWNDFKFKITNDLFVNEPFQRGRFLFRGHGSPNWELKSTFDRWFEGRRKTDKPKIADRLLSYFKRECEAAELTESVRDDEKKMLALAQHYGLPTRLLDWAESPYIAAFFAFSGMLYRKTEHPHVAVWALDSKSRIWSSAFGVEVLDVPSFSNIRLRNQTGKFTYLKAPYDTLEEYVSHFSDRKALRKYLIPVSEARRSLADLDMMGINYSRVFPDFVGYAQAAWMRVSLEYME